MNAQTYLAYDYPLLNMFWTMLLVFLWIMWFVLLFRIIGDIFRDDRLSGWAKAGWLVFCLLLPFLGVFVYVIARGKDMGPPGDGTRPRPPRGVQRLHQEDRER